MRKLLLSLLYGSSTLSSAATLTGQVRLTAKDGSLVNLDPAAHYQVSVNPVSPLKHFIGFVAGDQQVELSDGEHTFQFYLAHDEMTSGRQYRATSSEGEFRSHVVITAKFSRFFQNASVACMAVVTRPNSMIGQDGLPLSTLTYDYYAGHKLADYIVNQWLDSQILTVVTATGRLEMQSRWFERAQRRILNSRTECSADGPSAFNIPKLPTKTGPASVDRPPN